MRLVIARKLLLDAVSIVSSIITPNPFKEIFSCVSLGESNGKLELACFNIEEWIKLDMTPEEFDCEKGCEANIKATVLLNILKNADSENVTIETDMDKAIITYGKSTSKVPLHKSETYRSFSTQDAPMLVIDTKDFKDAIENVGFVSDSDILINKTKTDFEFATRSANLLSYSSFTSQNDTEFYLTIGASLQNTIKKVIELCDEHILVGVAKNGMLHISNKTGSVYAGLRKTEVNPYRYKNIIDGTPIETEIERSVLMKVVAQSVSASDNKSAVADVSIVNKAVVAKHKGGASQTKAKKDSDYSGDAMVFRINGSELIKSLKSCRNERIKVALTDKAFFIKDDENRIIVISRSVERNA